MRDAQPLHEALEELHLVIGDLVGRDVRDDDRVVVEVLLDPDGELFGGDEPHLDLLVPERGD